MPDIYISEEEKKSSKEQVESGGRMHDPHHIPGHSHNPFSAYFHWPERVKFETQEKEEKIVLMLRKHMVTNVSWLIIAALLALAPNALSFFPLIDFLPIRFQIIALVFWYLIVTAYVLESFLTWFFNVYIVTDERVVDIDFHNLIYREVTDAKLDKIQDVTYTLGGVVRTIFNYGDVMIQTAGTVPSIEFQAVPNPAEVARILQELRSEEEQEQLEGRVR